MICHAAARSRIFLPGESGRKMSDGARRLFLRMPGIRWLAIILLLGGVPEAVAQKPEMRKPVLEITFDAKGNAAEDQSGLFQKVSFRRLPETKPGIKGNAGYFSEGAHLSVRDAASLNPTDGLTLEAWMKPDPGYGEVRPRIFMKEQEQGRRGYSLAIQARGIVFDCAVEGKRESLLAGEELPVGRWTHVAATFDGKAARIYYNGIEKASRACPGKLTSAQGIDLNVGGFEQETMSRSFFGLLDDVRIYPFARTDFSEEAVLSGKVNDVSGIVPIRIAGKLAPIAVDIPHAEKRRELSGLYAVPVRWDSGNPLSWLNETGARMSLESGANTLVLEYIPSLTDSTPTKVVWEEPQDMSLFKKFPELKIFSGFMPWWQIKRPERLATVSPAFRDEFMVTQNGIPVTRTGGGLSPLSFWGPNTRSLAKICTLDRLRLFGGMDQVIGWNIPAFQSDNFYHGGTHDDITDYSEYSQKQYRTWLREVKAYTLESLNRTYGTSFRSWDDVKQPEPRLRMLDLRPSWKEFQEYRRWSVQEWFRSLISLTQSEDPRHRNVVRLWVSGGPPRHDTMTIPEDLFALVDDMKVFGFIEQTFGESSSALRIRHLSLQYAYGLSSSETGLPSGFYRSMYQNARFGYEMAFLKWIPPYMGHFRNPIVFERIRRYRGSFMASSGGIPLVPESRVAMLYSYHTAFSRLRLTDSCADLLEYLFECEYPYIYLSDLSPLRGLEKHRAIVLPYCQILPPDVIAKLRDYVAEGGTLVLLGDSGMYSTSDTEESKPSYRLYRELGFSGRLDARAGISGPVSLSGADPLFGGRKDLWMRNGWRIEVSPKWDGQVIAERGDGSPAMLRWRFGKGQTVMIGGEIPRADLRRMLETLGCAPLVKSADSEIKGGFVLKDGGNRLVLFNDSWKTKKISCLPDAVPGTYWNDLKTGASILLTKELLLKGIALELEPQECRVIMLEKSPLKDDAARESNPGGEVPLLLPENERTVLNSTPIRFEASYDRAEKGDIYFYLRGYEPAIPIGRNFLEYDIFIPADSGGFEAFPALVGDDYYPQSTLRFIPGITQNLSPSFFRPGPPEKGKWRSVKLDLSPLSPKGFSGLILIVRINNPAQLKNLNFMVRNLRLTDDSGVSRTALLTDRIPCRYDLDMVKTGQWTDTFCWGRRRWWNSASVSRVNAEKTN